MTFSNYINVKEFLCGARFFFSRSADASLSFQFYTRAQSYYFFFCTTVFIILLSSSSSSSSYSRIVVVDGCVVAVSNKRTHFYSSARRRDFHIHGAFRPHIIIILYASDTAPPADTNNTRRAAIFHDTVYRVLIIVTAMETRPMTDDWIARGVQKKKKFHKKKRHDRRPRKRDPYYIYVHRRRPSFINFCFRDRSIVVNTCSGGATVAWGGRGERTRPLYNIYNMRRT